MLNPDTVGYDTGKEEKPGAYRAQTEAEFRAIFEDAAIGITVVDCKGRPVRCNHALERILGYTEEELCSMSFPEFTHPDDLAADMELYRSLQAGERDYYQIEKRYIRKDGRIVWARLTISIVHQPSGKPEFVVGMVEDISAQKQAEEALRGSEETLRATVENTPNVAIRWYDEQGRILLWNRASELIYGWTSDEATGKTLGQLILDSEETKLFRKAFKEVELTGKSIPPTEFRFRRRDGSRGFGLSTLFRIRRGNGKFCFVCMDVDITERKQAEQSLREAQERELRSREEFTRQLLDAQEQERQRLAAELHDSLGQNLSIIKNNADLALAQTGIPAAAIQHLKAISRVASEAIGETRDLAHNLRPLQVEQLGLTDSIRELAEKVALSTPIPIEFRIENVDDAIRGASATHLYRIIQEALNNLTRHSSASRANLSLERDINCVRLRVTDNGCGFEVKPASLRGGLGLRNMAERAQMLGGSLNIESGPGTGTRLRVEVPIRDMEGPGA